MFRQARGIILFRQYSVYPKNNQIQIHDIAGRYAANLSKNASDIPIGHSPTIEIKPTTFKENSKFMELLHEKISAGIQNDFTFVMEAGANASTYMPIYDFREIPRFARTPNVDDIFGYVLVDSAGKIVPDSYEKNDLYRVCNASGLIKLSDYLLDEMRMATKSEIGK